MDFEIVHGFDATPEEVADALLDPAFQETLADIGPLKERTILSQEQGSDGRIVRKVRCVLDIDMPDAARAFIGDGDPSWVEESTWVPDEMRWEWVIHPEIARNMLSASGDIVIEESEEGAQRSVEGFVKIRGVPLYGGRVEGWIVDGLRGAYNEEAERLAKWLAGH